MHFNAKSHIGNKRLTNEDRYFARVQKNNTLLLVVADGMGGMPGGAKAASIAVDSYSTASAQEIITEAMMSQLALSAQQNILEYANLKPDSTGMGTTLTAVLVESNVLSWVHIGDSRLYRLRSRKLEQLTTDHRFIASLLHEGDISLEEARSHPFKNILDQCLGCPQIELEYGSAAIMPGDILLLCTDGIHDELTLEEMEYILAKNTPVHLKVESLVESALTSGGHDNITLIVAEL